jgi:hypothetical protein
MALGQEPVRRFPSISTKVTSRATFFPVLAPSTKPSAFKSPSCPSPRPLRITFTYDPTLKTFAPSTEETLGPILNERAGTIGRHSSTSPSAFSTSTSAPSDGKDLSKLPPSSSTNRLLEASNAQPSGMTGQFAGQPCFVRDYIQTVNNIDLTVRQYTIYATLRPHQPPRFFRCYRSSTFPSRTPPLPPSFPIPSLLSPAAAFSTSSAIAPSLVAVLYALLERYFYLPAPLLASAM